MAVDYATLKKGGFMRQKQKNHFSLRLRVVGGNLTATQLAKIAEVAEKFGDGHIHLTSRQSVEIPFVKLEQIEEVKKAFAQTLEKLGTDYLDMYLIHWPLPNPEYKDWKELDVETWRGLEELYKAGKVKAIGVSNFLLHHLENLIQNCEILPMADQIEFHPGFTQEATVRYCQEKGIYVQAWSPLGRKRVLEHPLLVGLAEKYNKSAAQICLRYEIQRQVIPLPKASKKERMVQNYQVFDFEIEKEDMYRIDSMQPAGWSGEHPDFPRVK